MSQPCLKNEEPITFLAANSAALILQARQLRHDVYLRAGYITQPCPLGIIPDANAADSIYIVAVNGRGLVVGTLGLSLHQPCRTFDTWNGRLYHQYSFLIQQARRKASFEIGALAVSKECAHLKISWGLYNMAYRWALANAKEYGIISMDQRAFRALEMVGWYAIQIGEPMNYFGSLSVPGIIPILEQPAFAAAKIQPWFNYSLA